MPGFVQAQREAGMHANLSTIVAGILDPVAPR
jgi:hypothetical protein